MNKDQYDLSNLFIFTDCSISILKKPIICVKPAKDPEGKTREQGTAYEPPAEEDSPAGGGEAGADSLGCGEGRGPSHRTEVTEEGREAAEGAERVSRIEH